jgi:hypothetical protein
MVMKMINKISVLLVLLSSTFVFAKDINDIEFGEFLNEEQLINLESYLEGLSHYDNIYYPDIRGVYTNNYSFFNSEILGTVAKKTIFILRGSNQVVKTLLEVKDRKCKRFLNLYKYYRVGGDAFRKSAFDGDFPIYPFGKDNEAVYLNDPELQDDFKEDLFQKHLNSMKEIINLEDLNNFKDSEYDYWKNEAALYLDDEKNLGIGFFSTNSEIDVIGRLKRLLCIKEKLILTEWSLLSKDTRNSYKEYTKYMEGFPFPEPFGFELYSKLNFYHVDNIPDEGRAKVTPIKFSEYFKNYFVEFTPDQKIITLVSGEYNGDDYEKVFMEVSKLIKLKYKTLGEINNDETMFYLDNSKWAIHLKKLTNQKKIIIDYYVRGDIYRDRIRQIDKIKSDSL